MFYGLKCHELRIDDQTKTWRDVYRIDNDAIVILEVFEKKTQKTPREVIESCKRRKLVGYDPAIVAERQEIITANGIIEVPKLRVEGISVGGAEAGNVEVICHDIPELAGIRGLLGLSFLRHFKTIIDYKQGYLKLS